MHLSGNTAIHGICVADRVALESESAGAGAPELVSPGGGRFPRWSPDGSTIYYRDGSRLMAAPFVSVDDAPRPGTPRVILDRDDWAGPDFEVSPGGDLLFRRLLPADTAPRPPIVVVLNWFEELKERVPTGR